MEEEVYESEEEEEEEGSLFILFCLSLDCLREKEMTK